MRLCKACRIILMSVLVSVSLCNCARRQVGKLSINNEQAIKGQQPQPSAGKTDKTAETLTMSPFQDLVVSLVSDSLDILPKNISDKIFEVIQKGIEVPDQNDEIVESVLSSKKKEDIAFIAGLIVQRIYGRNADKETMIPQAVLYSISDKVVLNDLVVASYKVHSSENRDLDAYNACLNLLVNSLSVNYQLQLRPKEGLYVRNSANELYFHSKMKHAEK